MNTTTQLQGALAHAAPTSFGRVARQRPAPVRPLQPVARDIDASNDHEFLRDASVASGLRAMAANGFGGIDVSAVALPVRRPLDFAPGDSPLLYRTAGIRELVSLCSGWIADVARASLKAWRRHRVAAATYRALSALDARTLRDIGLHRSEIGSISAEIGGGADISRIRSIH